MDDSVITLVKTHVPKNGHRKFRIEIILCIMLQFPGLNNFMIKSLYRPITVYKKENYIMLSINLGVTVFFHNLGGVAKLIPEGFNALPKYVKI